MVSKKFGDARRTKVTNILGEEEEPEEIQEQDIVVIYDMKTLQLKEKGKGTKKQNVIYTTNLNTLTLITDAGKMYNISLSKLKLGKEYKINEVAEIGGEHPRLLIDTMSFNAYKSLTCITKKGLIKKSHITDYLAELTKKIMAQVNPVLVTLGGETSYKCCKAIDSNELKLKDEVLNQFKRVFGV